GSRRRHCRRQYKASPAVGRGSLAARQKGYQTHNPDLPMIPLSEPPEENPPMATSFHYNFRRVEPARKRNVVLRYFCIVLRLCRSQPKSPQTDSPTAVGLVILQPVEVTVCF
ncbi:MAG: hypothetical protein NZ602_17195, partial [Thermoguttaceae bacterium]|nr:hypothetical protein [Thermoguttaceae bacterium]